ncbi:patatin-like phospholipase domain-containing protein 7 isoform X4 [Bolinopsis microptera]|uniref:patatin-like phospholipase domain-containing protein 7 isoform X4 n=1 Tax=Bolinopsis microptera TaxID=2820187 RepID=UPI00307901F4
MNSFSAAFKSAQELPDGDVQTIAYVISTCIVGLTVALFMYCCVSVKKTVTRRSASQPVASQQMPGPSRIRKRDKVANLTKKMFKKLPKLSITEDNHERFTTFIKRPAKSFQEIQKALERSGTLTLESARKLIHGHQDHHTRISRINVGPPSSVLEASMVDHDYRLPPELKNILQSVRVFGNFEQPVFLELCKYVTSSYHPRGSLLNDLDTSFYVIQSGQFSVFTEGANQKQHVIKKSYQGDSIFSLLTILDMISLNKVSVRSEVYARADTDCYLLKLPTSVFRTIHSKSPESMFRFVQVILLRLSRVTYLSLHKYLGLTKELVEKDIVLPEMNIHCLTCQKKPRSGKARRRQRSRSNTNNSATSNLSADGEELFEEASEDHRPRPVFDMEGPAAKTESSLEMVLAESAPHENVDDNNIIKIAVEDLVKLLGLKDETVLEGKVTLVHIARGSVICKQGDVEKFLTFVVSGHLEVTQHDIHDNEEAFLYTTKLGEFIGVMSVLTGDPSQVTVTAIKRSIILTISRADIIKLIRSNPATLEKLTHQFTKRISLFVRQMDYALEWVSLEAGHALYRQGEASHSTYIVLSGRLRSVLEHDNGRKELVSEFGRGDTIGVIEFATGSPHTHTVLAVRDTELGKIPEGLLNTIKLWHPKTVSRLIQLLGNQVLGQVKYSSREQPHLHKPLQQGGPGSNNIHHTPNTNLATVALLPCTRNVPLHAFSAALCSAVNTIGPCTRLTSSLIIKQLGSDALNSVYECQLTNHLNSVEDQNRIVLYQADPTMTPWTRQCIRQADVILIIAVASENPEEYGPIEVSLNSMSVRAQKELILLHPDTAKEPTNTVAWLNARGWVSSHLHVRCSDYILRDMPPLQPDDFNPHSDMARVARRLTGTCIGVVLGGGGARGIAHIGILQALEDHGIPIDMIGGTSIGSMMGALYASETDVGAMRERAAVFSAGMSKLWNKIIDLTYPFTAMFRGKQFNKGIEDAIGEKLIENLWIPYFCVSTDLTASEARIHTEGCLWRYVRASMTLSGYLPPLCDPVDGHLLVDGGYVNNLPADIMSQRMGAQTIITVDVGGQSDNEFDNFGDDLSGWWVLWNRYFPFGKTLKIPNMAEIQSRLAYVSCERQLAQIKSQGGMEKCYHIRPPIDRYATLQFGSFDEIEETGYKHGTDIVSAWVKGGIVLQQMLAETKPGISGVPTQTPKTFVNYNDVDEEEYRRARAPSPYASFTDIAAMVSRIDPPKDHEGHGRPEFARRQMSWPSGAYETQSYSDTDDSSESDDPIPVFGGKHTMPDGLAGFYSDGDIPQDSTLCDDPVTLTHLVRHFVRQITEEDEDLPGAMMGESI